MVSGWIHVGQIFSPNDKTVGPEARTKTECLKIDKRIKSSLDVWFCNDLILLSEVKYTNTFTVVWVCHTISIAKACAGAF
jgi:hypothetical protein